MGDDGVRHNAPTTFGARMDAEAWLAEESRLRERGGWTPPAVRKAAARAPKPAELTFERFSATWLRERDIKPRTRAEYDRLLSRHLVPAFGDMPLAVITLPVVRTWYSSLGTRTPTLRSRLYTLLSTIMNTAVQDDLIPANPCQIRGAGQAKRARQIEPARLDELDALESAMPAERRAIVVLAVWCGLRFGELAELRRKDIDLEAGVVRVRRAVVRVKGEVIVGPPKSEAGVRNVTIPPHVCGAVHKHLAEHVGRSRESLLFPSRSGQQLAPSSFYGNKPSGHNPGSGFYGARAAAGRPDLRLHDLRHTGAVLAAQAGATLAELQNRFGHSTAQAAMRYQHAAAGRDAIVAARMSEMALASRPSASAD